MFFLSFISLPPLPPPRRGRKGREIKETFFFIYEKKQKPREQNKILNKKINKSSVFTY